MYQVGDQPRLYYDVRSTNHHVTSTFCETRAVGFSTAYGTLSERHWVYWQEWMDLYLFPPIYFMAWTWKTLSFIHWLSWDRCCVWMVLTRCPPPQKKLCYLNNLGTVQFHSEDQQCWGDLWLPVSPGTFCSVHSNWYIFLYAKKKIPAVNALSASCHIKKGWPDARHLCTPGVNSRFLFRLPWRLMVHDCADFGTACFETYSCFSRTYRASW